MGVLDDIGCASTYWLATGRACKKPCCEEKTGSLHVSGASRNRMSKGEKKTNVGASGTRYLSGQCDNRREARITDTNATLHEDLPVLC